MKKVFVVTGVIFLIILCFNFIKCNYLHRRFPTVNGPEAVDLISRIDEGTILLGVTKDKQTFIKAIELPQLDEKFINIPSNERLEYLSGPDQEGRILYVKGVPHYENNTHTDLVLTTIEGTYHDVIFSQNEDVLDIFPINIPLISLAPKNGYFTVIKKKSYEENILQIWGIKERNVIVEFLVTGPCYVSWFPDGLKIAYDTNVHYSKIPDFQSLSQEKRILYSKSKLWPMVSAIFIYDLSTNTHSFFHVGGAPIVSMDGKSILFEDRGPDGKYMPYLADVETKETISVDWPGRYYPARWVTGVIAFAGRNKILFAGYPTLGRKVKTVLDSPLVGYKLLPSIKIADLSTREFQTVIDYIHPYDAITYGRKRK